MARSLRRSMADDLGMRRALSSRLLPLLVGAMVFLAALALAGAMAASSLAARWSGGAAAMVTVTLPMQAEAADDAARLAAVGRVLAQSPAVALSRQLTQPEIAGLLKPWLGEDPGQLSLRLPAMFEVRLNPGVQDPSLASRLAAAAPGALLERNDSWLARLTALVRSLRASAALALLVVAFVAASVVCVATRAGLAVSREAIEIVHGLGAADGLIAGQFSSRMTMLVLSGAVLGVLMVVPVLLELARLAAPFASNGAGPAGALPPLLWGSLAALPVLAALIGWITAQATVRAWLLVLP